MMEGDDEIYSQKTIINQNINRSAYGCVCNIKNILDGLACVCSDKCVECLCRFIKDCVDLRSYVGYSGYTISGKADRYALMFLVQYGVYSDGDSKTFVDMVMRRPFEEIHTEYTSIIDEHKIDLDELMNKFVNSDICHTELIGESLRKRICKFVEDNFYNAEHDLANLQISKNDGELGESDLYNIVTGRERSEESSGMQKYNVSINPRLSWICDLTQDLQDMCVAIVKLWQDFRKINHDVGEGLTTLIKLNGPFIIPGGRFREFYYWDSYWILLGLPASDEEQMAFDVVKRFTEIIKRYGFVPNGTREYYTDRTQPPMFTKMILHLYESTDSKEIKQYILNESLKAALIEYDFFMIHKRVHIKNQDGILLNMYKVHSDTPRPESYKEDIKTYKQCDTFSRPNIYSNLKIGAESGWDYSSRWFADGKNITSIDIINIIPVDLNAYMYSNEKDLISLLSKCPNTQSIIDKLKKNNKKREYSMNRILWNNEKGIWSDFNLRSEKFTSRFYLSDITPILCGMHPPNCSVFQILFRYRHELFGYPGGVPVSEFGETKHKQQWDFPNTWAPLVHMLIDCLLRIGADDVARHAARCFIRSVKAYFKRTGRFQEKYNVVDVGKSGSGGEYESQEGFGWTNGVVIWLIKTFGNSIDDCDHDESYLRVISWLKDVLSNNQ